MTIIDTQFPIDLGTYKPLALNPANSSLTSEQRETLKANIQLCRDAIVFFTATGAASGVGGHTGGTIQCQRRSSSMPFSGGHRSNLCRFSLMRQDIESPRNI